MPSHLYYFILYEYFIFSGGGSLNASQMLWSPSSKLCLSGPEQDLIVLMTGCHQTCRKNTRLLPELCMQNQVFVETYFFKFVIKKKHHSGACIRVKVSIRYHKTSPQLLQLFTRMLQHCFALKLETFFVDYETSPNFPSTLGEWTMTKLSFLGELFLY